MSRKLISIFLLSILLLTACRRENNESLPNPASVFCLEQGGTHEIRTNPDGSQTGFCLFTDGSECEEWDYFNAKCGPVSSSDTNDDHATDQTPALANPASVFCLQNGGESILVTNNDSSVTGFCKFADGSQCDEWEYFRGECQPLADFTPVAPKN